MFQILYLLIGSSGLQNNMKCCSQAYRLPQNFFHLDRNYIVRRRYNKQVIADGLAAEGTKEFAQKMMT